VIVFRYTGGMFHDEPFHCGLIKSREQKPGKTYPLICWVSGIGREELEEKAAVGHPRWLEQVVRPDKPSRDEEACFILVMHITEKKDQWFDRHGDAPPADARDLGDEQITVYHELLKKVLTEHAIDPERIYLMGLSAGGVACFEMAMRYPQLFAAM
jgi:predicted peptidase